VVAEDAIGVVKPKLLVPEVVRKGALTAAPPSAGLNTRRIEIAIEEDVRGALLRALRPDLSRSATAA